MQVAGEHVDDAGSMRRLILKALQGLGSLIWKSKAHTEHHFSMQNNVNQELSKLGYLFQEKGWGMGNWITIWLWLMFKCTHFHFSGKSCAVFVTSFVG